MANLEQLPFVQDLSSSYSSSSITLLGTPPTGTRAFSLVGNSNFCFYKITDTSGNFEENYGKYATSGTTLSREATPINSSNSGAQVSFSGTVTISLINPSSFFQSIWAGQNSSRYSLPCGFDANQTQAGAALATTTVYYIPVLIEQPFRSVTIQFDMTGSPTGTMAVGLYNTLNGQPNALLGSQTGISTISSGVKTSSSIPTGICAPGLYWIALLSSAANSLNSSICGTLRGIIGTTTVTTTSLTSGYKQSTSSLPNPAASLSESTAIGSGVTPLVGVLPAF